MTQAINFDDLKTAFAPVKTSAKLTRISGDAFRASDDQKAKIKALKEENLQLSDQLKAHQERFETLDTDYKKALRHVSLLMQEKETHENDFQKLHEDKMRSVRMISNKNQESEEHYRKLVKAQQRERQMEIKLSHAKVDVKKQIEKQQQLAKIVEDLKAKNAQLEGVIEAMKVDKSLKNRLQEKFNTLYEFSLELMSGMAIKLANRLKKKDETEAQVIKWTSTKTALPKRACNVFVRNGYQADIASFDPRTRRFKLVNKEKMDVQEWAPISQDSL
jgi:DNA repair exonuclease SbcCD ATPase subunit